MSVSKTIVISCAGMGKRLGIGTSKCLVDVAGKPLIIRNLEMLDDVDDVRVVVGFQAQRVIDMVNSYRKDVTFVFNHDYAHTNTGASVALAAKHANDYVLTIDGDLLLHPDDMRKVLGAEGEFVGVTAPGTDNPVLTDVEGDRVLGFSREHGSYEWTGVAQLAREHVGVGTGHTYQLVEPWLPLPWIYLRTREIDTPNDYDNAVRWVRGGYSDEVIPGVVGGMGSYATVDFFRRIVDAFPARYEWERPRVLIDNRCTMPSRVRAILYGERRNELVRELAESVRNLVASGATHVFLACNTSHVFLDEIRALVPDAAGYVVNMIDLLAKGTSERGAGNIFLLASEGTIASGIYQDEFAKYSISVDPADKAQQVRLRDFIEVVKQNKVTLEAKEEFAAFVRDLEYDDVVLGCTELPILVDGGLDYGGAMLLDPMQAAIDFLMAQKAREKDGEPFESTDAR